MLMEFFQAYWTKEVIVGTSYTRKVNDSAQACQGSPSSVPLRLCGSFSVLQRRNGGTRSTLILGCGFKTFNLRVRLQKLGYRAPENAHP